VTSSFGIRTAALPAWHRLHLALADAAGPAPCSSLPDAWWSDDDELIELAVNLCGRCPVIAECAAFAIANKESSGGIWAGKQRTPKRGRPAATRKEVS